MVQIVQSRKPTTKILIVDQRPTLLRYIRVWTCLDLLSMSRWKEKSSYF